MKRRTRTVVQWRVRSQAPFLTAHDLLWTEFCTIDEPGKPKPPLRGGSAEIILAALNNWAGATTVPMEYRLKPNCEPKLNP